MVRPSISPQYTWRISDVTVSGVQENWRIWVKIWKGLGALVRAHGNIFLRWYFVSTNGVFWLKISLSKASNSTTVNFTEFSTISGKTSFCRVLHVCSLPSTEEGGEWIFQSSKAVDWALNSSQCYQCMCPLCLWEFSNVLNVNKVLFVGALRLCEFEFGLFRIFVINVVFAQKYFFSVWGAGSCCLGKIPTINDIYFIINQGWTFFSTYVLRWTGDVRKGKWSPKFDKANTNISQLLLRFWDEWSTD